MSPPKRHQVLNLVPFCMFRYKNCIYICVMCCGEFKISQNKTIYFIFLYLNLYLNFRGRSRGLVYRRGGGGNRY